MPKYNYVAMDSHGKGSKGTLEVASQNEAIGRVKDMGLFPTRIVEIEKEKPDKKAKPTAKAPGKKGGINFTIKIPGPSGKVIAKVLTTFTRQLATLVDAGLPLLRGLRVLEKQEKNPTLKSIVSELALSIEGGSTFSEALAQHPKVFNRLFVNMVKAGELGGVLEVVLARLPKFKEVFVGLAEGQALPAFTRLVMGISDAVKDHILYTLAGLVVFIVLFTL